MVKIGILSDTHGSLHPRVFDFFNDCHEIWHAGDVGSLQVIRQLENFKKLRGVYGNIDGREIRTELPEFQLFSIENVKVLITHIAGYPGKFNMSVLNEVKKHAPDILVAGHSHILKVMYDNRYKLLFINPGAAGNHGFHHKITWLRFQIDGKEFKEMEIMEIDRPGLSDAVNGT